jgi:TPP-dependent indolepyruvate ferredoxin oxidoreductase alpha subunit
VASVSERPVFAVSGDGAFLHSGKTALEEVCRRGVKLRVFVFANGGCHGTGGQEIPGSLECPFTGLDSFRVSWKDIEMGVLGNRLKTAPVPPRPELWIIFDPPLSSVEKITD